MTGLKSFRGCRRRFAYEQFDRLAPLETSPVHMAFQEGTAGHYALEQYYAFNGHKNPNITPADFLDANAFSSPERLGLFEKMLQRYKATYGEYEAQSWEVLHTEQTFSYKINDDVELVGTIDMIIKQGNRIFGVDHKFLKAPPNEKTVSLDDQFTGYWFLLEQAGINVHGFIYNALIKAVPEVPTMLKDGSLSVSKTQKTDLHTYTKAAEFLGIDLKHDKYKDYLEHLKNSPSTYFVREPILKTPYSTREFKRTLEHISREIIHGTKDRSYMYPSPSYTCPYCPFQFICESDSQGADTSIIKERLFRIKEENER